MFCTSSSLHKSQKCIFLSNWCSPLGEGAWEWRFRGALNIFYSDHNSWNIVSRVLSNRNTDWHQRLSGAMLQIQCKMSRDATSVSNPLETEVTSNYIRATPGFNRGCVSNVGKILSARLYCICTKTCTSNWHHMGHSTPMSCTVLAILETF